MNITNQIIAINLRKLEEAVEEARTAIAECRNDFALTVLEQNLEGAQARLNAYREQHGLIVEKEVVTSAEQTIIDAIDEVDGQGVLELPVLAAIILANAMDEVTGGCAVSRGLKPLRGHDEVGLLKSWIVRALDCARGSLRLTMIYEGTRPVSGTLFFDPVQVGQCTVERAA